MSKERVHLPKEKGNTTEPREAALTQVDHDTARQQDRTRVIAVRRQHKAASTQSEHFIAKARELGLDEREETFDAALKKVARHRPEGASKPFSEET